MVPALITALILNRDRQLRQRLDPPVAEARLGSCHCYVCHLHPSGSSLGRRFPKRSKTFDLAKLYGFFFFALQGLGSYNFFPSFFSSYQLMYYSPCA